MTAFRFLAALAIKLCLDATWKHFSFKAFQNQKEDVFKKHKIKYIFPRNCQQDGKKATLRGPKHRLLYKKSKRDDF